MVLQRLTPPPHTALSLTTAFRLNLLGAELGRCRRPAAAASSEAPAFGSHAAAPAAEGPNRHPWPSLPSSGSMWGFQTGNQPPAQQAWPQQQQQQHQPAQPLQQQQGPAHYGAMPQKQQQAAPLPSALPVSGGISWLQQGSRAPAAASSMSQQLASRPAGDIKI